AGEYLWESRKDKEIGVTAFTVSYRNHQQRPASKSEFSWAVACLSTLSTTTRWKPIRRASPCNGPLDLTICDRLDACAALNRCELRHAMLHFRLNSRGPYSPDVTTEDARAKWGMHKCVS